ncbi:MAG TPA: hypothetical protein VGO93_24440, partial [Candidatus Xenobia bacterium]
RTGNEGTTVDLWYDGAVVVLWPETAELVMVGREGHKVGLPVLKSVAGDRERIDSARRLAASIMDHWNVQYDYGTPQFAPSETMLKCLQALDDAKLAARFIQEFLPSTCTGSEGKILTSLCRRLGWQPLAPALEGFLAAERGYDRGETWRAALAVWRDLCCHGDANPDRTQACRQVAEGLTDLMTHWDEVDRWGVMGRGGVLEILFESLGAIDRIDLLDGLLDRALADPQRYSLHQVLIPAVKALTPLDAAVENAFKRLHAHCQNQLAERTREPARFPTDWSMEVQVSCRCKACQDLQAFLRDPQQRTWSYRAREDLRQHVSHWLQGTDVQCATERLKSPYTLVCTKTRVSYEKRQQQYESDCDSLRELKALAAAAGLARSSADATPASRASSQARARVRLA